MSFPLMSGSHWLQVIVYFSVLFVCAIPLGAYMAKVYSGERTFMSPVLGWTERGFYRIAGIDPHEDMRWQEYAVAVFGFSLVSLTGIFLVLLFQGSLPLNPASLPDLSLDSAFNSAVSAMTGTGWMSYSPEAAISPFSQLIGFVVQSFFSTATSLAVMAALVRSFVRSKTSFLGNFWADLVRSILYILLPLVVILAVVLVSQGVVQTFKTSVDAAWLDPSVLGRQTISLGPAAVMVAAKQLTIGQGFFNANAAHPFENPTPLSNFLELLAVLLLPAAQFFMFGRMVGDKRQGLSLLIAMSLVLLPLFFFGLAHEQAGNPLLPPLGIEQSGGNMEGKETRIGVPASMLWASVATASTNGSANAALDSFMPLGLAVPFMLMQFDESIFGGIGSGLYTMLVFVIITVFIAGFMAGRTPEYLGKKIQIHEIKMATLVMLMPHMISLIGAALAMSFDAGKAGVFNPGAQGFNEIFYAYTSAANTNGSILAGIAANTPFYNISLGIVMLAGRFLVILPILAMAGSLAQEHTVRATPETLSTTSPLFVVFLIAIVVIVGVLAFLPTLALGPIAEHFHLTRLSSLP